VIAWWQAMVRAATANVTGTNLCMEADAIGLPASMADPRVPGHCSTAGSRRRSNRLLHLTKQRCFARFGPQPPLGWKAARYSSSRSPKRMICRDFR
jgi:hypothetical protein